MDNNLNYVSLVMLGSQFTVFSDRQSPFTVNNTMQSQFTANCLFTDHEKLKTISVTFLGLIIFGCSLMQPLSTRG